MSYEEMIREILKNNNIGIDKGNGNQLLIAVDGVWKDLITYISEVLYD